MRGGPLEVIQELLGHATMNMRMLYAQLAPALKRDAVLLLESILHARLLARLRAGSRDRSPLFGDLIFVSR